MPQHDFLKITNSDDLKEKLNNYVISTKFEKFSDDFGLQLLQKDFDWLLPIIKTSLDKQLSEYLTKEPPISTRYINLDVIEHLKEATDIINKCNDRRTLIYDLEAKGIFSALEYFQFLETLEAEIKLGKLNINAIYTQSELPDAEENYQKAFDEKTISALGVLRTKLSLHNKEGNSLNYGERVKYLRDLYCDDVKTIYERLIAIKRVLKYSFGQETASLPNFVDVTTKLDLLVWWMRDTVREFESQAEYEYFFEKTISLNTFSSSGKPVPESPFGDHHVDNKKILIQDFKSQPLLTLINNGQLDFTLTEDDFRLPKDLIGGKTHLRIISIAVNIIEDTDHEPQSRPSRNTRLYFCELISPKQEIQLDLSEIYDITQAEQEEAKDEIVDFLKIGKKGKTLSDLIAQKGKLIGIDPSTGRLIFESPAKEFEKFSFPNRFIVGDVKPVHETSILDNQNFQSPKSIRNINPIGLWNVSLQNSTQSNMQRFFGLTQIMDFSITFRIGVRK